MRAMGEMDITTLRLDRPGIRAALGDLEAQVMERVWARASDRGVTVREIWEDLHSTHPVMYTTVMNTMTRLARKGLLSAEREERAHVYRPALDREAFVGRFVGGALERLLVNFGGATRQGLKAADPAAAERLLALLDEAARRRGDEPAG